MNWVTIALFNNVMTNEEIAMDTEYQNKLFILAAMSGDVQGALTAIENGASVGVQQNKALNAACKCGNIDMMELLIAKGIDIHLKEENALIEAVTSHKTISQKWG